MNNRNLPLYCILLLLSFLYLLIFVCSVSPLFRYPSLDSDTFQMMGLNILHGGTPYIDLFDHKGPVLYFIEALGLSISLNWGILIIHTIALFISSSLWLKSLKLCMPQNSSKMMICMLLGFFMLFTYESGNMTEDWSLPFISYCIYTCIKAIKDCDFKLSTTQTIIVGLCFSAVSLIRINNLFECFGFLLFLLYKNIVYKRYLYIMKTLALFASGYVSLLLCVCVWFLFKGGLDAVSAMWIGTIGFNLDYMAQTSGNDLLFAVKSYAPLVFFVVLSLFAYKNRSDIVIPLIASFFLGSLVVGGSLYRHYFIVFVPLIVLSIGVVMDSKYNKWMLLLVIAVGFVAAINPLNRSLLFFENKQWTFVQQRKNQFFEIASREHLQESTVWLYGAGESLDLLLSNNIVPSNKYILPHLPDISDKLKSELGSVKLQRPQYLLRFSDFVIHNEDDIFELDHYYVKYDSILYPERHINLYIYKRNS